MSISKRRLIIGGAVLLAICVILLTGFAPIGLIAALILIVIAERLTA
jgi:hypothetical protein